MWVFGNIILAISLLPSVIALISGQTGLAIVFSIFALLTLAGLAQILVKPLNSGVPQWSDMRKGNYKPAVSAWLALSTIASLFAFPGLAVQSVLAVLALILSPILLCLPCMYPTTIRLAWRNALVIAIHYPFIALGFPALGFIFSWLVVLTRGALFLVLPTLWLAIVLVSLQEIAKELQNQNSFESWAEK